MDLLEQPEIKDKYNKYKYIVKLWEHTFKKKHNRIPSKLDIKEAPNDVKYAYKRYFQLKSAALEQSFMDVDGFNSDEDENNSQNIASLQKSNFQFSNDSISDLATINESPTREKEENCEKVAKSDENEVNIEKNVDGTWGEHLNNKKANTSENSAEKAEKMNLSASFSQKLFCGSKFSKRNPRKSLSFSQKRSESTIVDPGIFLSQPGPLSQNFSTFSSEDALNMLENASSSFHSNFRIVAPQNKIQTQQVNILRSVSEASLKSKPADAGWLQRVAQSTGIAIEKDSGVHSLSSATKIDYDSDEIIEDSEDEEIPLHIAKKIRTDSKLFRSAQNISDLGAKRVISKEYSASAFNLHSEIIENAFILNNDLNKSKTDFDLDTINKNIREIDSKSIENIENPKIDNETDKIDNRDLKIAENDLNIINTELIEDSINNSKSKSKKQAKKTPKSIKSKTKSSKIASPSIPCRRSSRQNKNKVNLRESFESDEDPFKSDYDDKDPEFNIEPTSSIPVIEEKPVKTPKKRQTAKSKLKSNEVEKPEDGSLEKETYELDYSVKARVVAPRFKNIKSIIKSSNVSNSENKVKDRKEQNKDKLSQKLASGNLNENYVRVNLKKKVFVRGKKNINFSKYKKALWRSKKKALAGPDMDMGGCDGGTLTCFNCGQEGHFARQCKQTKGDGLLPKEAADDEEPCPYPTLEEASQMAKDGIHVRRAPNLPETADKKNKKIEDDINLTDTDTNEESLDELDDDFDEELVQEVINLEEQIKELDVRQYMDEVKVVQPYYNLDPAGQTIATPSEVFEALQKFGHSTFRPGQELAVMRILSGKSTLVTLSTGSGKSLCYQLPAFLYAQREPCISLVISPLVSLMEDQVTGVPSFLKAACLHTNQTKSQREKVMDAIYKGNLNILLVSPEAVVAGEKQSGFGSIFRHLPAIAFACIDEAHCVSQWSHNFRPSYLMICRVLRESLGVSTILGLTATATRSTSDSIVEHLRIPDGRNGIISDTPLPDNLILTVSKDKNRDHALLRLLLSEKFSQLKSIIVYCTRRDECERLATFLRTSLKNEKLPETSSKKRKRLNLQAEPYHAGLSASRRRTIQNAFMSGELRIVVATVAFGMGINKSDIRAVIHYNMPKSFESYVQEVGRAGRDGLKAYCHLFLDAQGRDENELRRHIHANSIDRHVIRKLLQRIFVGCSCTGQCPKHEVAFSIEETVRALDVPEEIISTLLCYLELHDKKYIQLLKPAYTFCKVISYGGPLEIRKAAKECPPLAMALALHKNDKDPNVLEFPIVDVASAMGWESGICKFKLKNLEWTTGNEKNSNRQPKRSKLTVRFSNLGFHMLAPGNLADNELDEALDSLYNRVVKQEQTALLQLHAVYENLMKVAAPSYQNCIDEENSENELKIKIREYFESPNPLKEFSDLPENPIDNEEQLISDIKALVCMYRDNSFTGRAVARIFHGIQSPNYPAVIWGRCKFWRSRIGQDFHAICRIATREILKMR